MKNTKDNMRIFMENARGNGVMDVEEYIYASRKKKQVFVGEDFIIKKLFKFNYSRISDKYIAGLTTDRDVIPLKVIENTEEGLTLEEVKLDVKLTLTYNGFLALSSGNILFVCNENAPSMVINLDKGKCIAEIPGEYILRSKMFESENIMYLHAINRKSNSRYSVIVCIKNGESVSVIEGDFDVAVHYVNGIKFCLIKNLYTGSKDIIYFNTKTERLEEGWSFDNIISSYNKNGLGIKGNKLYLIEAPDKEPTLIKEFENKISAKYRDNFVIVKDGGNDYLVDFAGVIIDEDIYKVYKADEFVISNTSKLGDVMYSKLDGTKWLYDLDTREKIELDMYFNEDGYGYHGYIITAYDFKLSATMKGLEEICEEHELNDEEIYYLIENNYPRDLKSEEIKNAVSKNNVLTENRKIFVAEHSDNVALYLIENGKVAPIFTKDGEIQLIEMFALDTINNDIGIIAINKFDGYESNGIFIDIDETIEKVESGKHFVITEEGEYRSTNLKSDELSNSLKEAYARCVGDTLEIQM